DQSRMLIVDRRKQSWRDSAFAELPSLLEAGDVVVLNNTRVFPARLLGHRMLPGGERGAQVEVLLARLVDAASNEWEVIGRPGRALKLGAQLEFGHGRLHGEVAGLLEDGKRRVRFACEGDFNQVVDEIGKTPLPPYIKREQSEERRLNEPRYQTVYAQQR